MGVNAHVAERGTTRNLSKPNLRVLAFEFLRAETTALDVDTSLLDQGIIDSTGVLEVIGFIEETYGIMVEDSELLPENLDSIEGIAQYVIRKSNPVPLRMP